MQITKLFHSFNEKVFSQGGMKAVIWTDVFQAVIMIAGMSAIVIQVTLGL